MKTKFKYILVSLFALFIALMFFGTQKSYATIVWYGENKEVPVSVTLTNAPYNNKEYCEEKLIQEFTIDLLETTGTATCSNYPQSVNLTNVIGVLNETEKTYSKGDRINFADTNFSGVGDCIFVVYPKGSTTDKNKYKIAIHVNSEVDQNNVVTGNTKVTIWQNKENVETNEKVEDINIAINNPNTYIKLDKVVKGDIADIEKKFTFNVKIDGYTNDNYTVVAPTGNSTSHIVERTGTEIVGKEYTLAHNESLTIGKNGTTMQIPVGTKYTITETTDGYKAKYKKGTESETTETKDTDTTLTCEGVASETEEENAIKFTNTKNAGATTGVFYNVLPFIAVMSLAVVGIFLMKRTKKK